LLPVALFTCDASDCRAARWRGLSGGDAIGSSRSRRLPREMAGRSGWQPASGGERPDRGCEGAVMALSADMSTRDPRDFS